MNARINREPSNRLLLPRVGGVKIGKKNERGFPESVDYFIPTGKYAALFTQAFGDKPQTIQIIFPDDDPAKVCSELYEYRDDAGKRIAYGDGQVFYVWDGKGYAEMTVKEHPNLMLNVAKRWPNNQVRKGSDGWQITLTLTFIIPMVRGIAGVWQFVSKGIASSIPNIRDTFDVMLAQKKKVSGIIFDLNVQFAKTQKPGDKSRYPVVTMVPNESEGNIRMIKEALKPVKVLENE